MSVLCGWASINEHGRARGGASGDQTGREVKIGPWYNFGQTVCLRWKNPDHAKEYAKIIKALCNNRHVGYDQDQRTTLHNALKALKWDYTQLVKDCETDCSAMVAAAVNCVFRRQVVSSSIYTGNLVQALMNTGYFKKLTGSKYCSSSDYLCVGDILNRSGHHVISVLENGPKAGVKSDFGKVAEPNLRKGSTGSEVKKLQSNLNQLGFKDSNNHTLVLDGIFGASTKEALLAFQKKYGLEVDGIYGTKSYTVMSKKIK